MPAKSANQITIDEHDDSLFAKKTTIVSLKTWVTSTITLTNANTAYLLPASELSSRKTLVVYNISDTAVYFGDSSITTSTGILLGSGATLTIDAENGIYAVCAVAGKILNLLEGK